MAYTRIHAVTATVGKAVAYICNKSKTDQGILITAHACSPATAEYDFEFALSKTDRNNKNLAYHLIQSFAPGEVTPEEAHRIGVELMDELLHGEHSYVVSTHTNTGQVHNHCVFCAANNITHRKYNHCKKTYRQIRSISDRLCAGHGLSVIIPGASKTAPKDRVLWEKSMSDFAWRDLIRRDIDDAISQVTTYPEFLEMMRAKGYSIKGDTENDGKYLAFRPMGKERFVRGSGKSLGAEYTRERIMGRIESGKEYTQKAYMAQDKTGAVWEGNDAAVQAPAGRENASDGILSQNKDTKNIAYTRNIASAMNIANTKNITNAGDMRDSEVIDMMTWLKKQERRLNSATVRYSSGSAANGKLIDISAEKFQKNPGLMNWAKKQNLKIAAGIYLTEGSLSEIEQEISVKRKVMLQAQSTVKQLDTQMRELAEIIHYAEQYQECLPYYEGYMNAEDQEKYFRKHEAQIILFDGAKNVLEMKGIKGKQIDPVKYRQQFAEIENSKTAIKQHIETFKLGVKQLELERLTLQEFLTNSEITPKTIMDPYGPTYSNRHAHNNHFS